MLKCPHCDSSNVESAHLETPASENSAQELPSWDGLCTCCGRSLYEEHPHDAAPAPEPFDSQNIQQPALDVLEQTSHGTVSEPVQENDQTLLPEWGDSDQQREMLAEIWGQAKSGEHTGMTHKWAQDDSEQTLGSLPEEFSLPDDEMNHQSDPHASVSYLQTCMPAGEDADADQNDPSALLTFAPENNESGSIVPTKKNPEHTHGRSLSIRTRSLSHDVSQRAENSDYELLDVLGKGGMGVVYKARQASIDREVALKMVKTETVTPKQRKSFISEAVVTGELDHPNIVPIYDLGTDEAGALFYSMKQVEGTPWKDVIGEKSQSENLEILQRVADAVAFGHSKGVVHCDLKPENVMLGGYGEVLVMDWGLAQLLPGFCKPREVAKSADGGGTPAYMAPEMAAGKPGLIRETSDVYLLGAILYQIITGHAPHAGKSVMDCLVNVAKNNIQPTDKTGELVDIAYRAMETRPEDRFANVSDFQQAIREYQSHSESIRLSDRALAELEQAHENQDYELFAQSLAAFRESLLLWEENSAAKEGLNAARFAYAQCAFQKGDFDLGLSLLEADNPDHTELYQQILAAQLERDVRQQRLRRTKRLVAALGILMVTGATVAAFVINEARKEANGQREIAEQQAQVAEEQRGIAQKQSEWAKYEQTIAEKERKKAESARDEAVVQKGKAESAKQAADAARQLEVQAKLDAQKAETAANAARVAKAYEAYVARIQLAAAKIDENAFDTARRLLQECLPGKGEPDLRGWEWSRLMHLCHQSQQTWDLKAPAESVAFSPDGLRFVTAAWDGFARVWDAQTGQELLTLKHQGQYIHSAKFSPDGKWIATGSNDSTGFVRIWNSKTGAPVKSFFGHTDAVLSVRFSRDGNLLVTTSYDNTARLWDVASGRELQKFEGHFWWVWNAAFSPDETRLVTASHDGTANVYDIKTGKKIADFTGHRGPVFVAEFSPDGQTIATGGFDHRVLLWKPEDQPWTNLQLLAEGKQDQSPVFTALDSHTSGVRTLEYSSDGRRLLTGSDDNTLKLWNLETKRPLETLRGHDGWIAKCTLSPDGKWALSASHDQHVRLWNLGGYEETRVLGGHVLNGHGDVVLNAALSRDGQFAATASRDRTARLWSVKHGTELKTFAEGHSFLSMRAIFSPDGRWLFTAAFDNTVRVWNVAHGTEVARLDRTGRSAALAVSPDGKYLVTGSNDNSAKVWELESVLKAAHSQQPPKPHWVLKDHRREITTLAISPDGTFLYTGDAKGRGCLWNQSTSQLHHRLEGHALAITSAVFLPDGSKVYTASRDNSVGVWDVKTGKELREQTLKHATDVTSLAMLPSGKKMITSCDDKTVRLWNLETRQVETVLHQGDDIHTLDISPDGKLVLGLSSVEGCIRVWHLDNLKEWTTPNGNQPPKAFFELVSDTDSLWSATFSPDNHGLLTVAGNDVRLWNLNTREERMSFNPHGAVASAEFSPDGQWLVTAGWDHTARIWNLKTGKSEQKLHGKHTDDINSAVFSPDGKRVLTASDDGTAVLWNRSTGQPEVTFKGHGKRINSAVFSTDGRWVLTASDDRTARVWNAQTGEECLILEGHDWAVQSAEFSQDGQQVITGSDDNTARIWELKTDGQKKWSSQLQWILKGHSAAVVASAFTPDGRRVITGSRDDTAIIWDAQTGQELLTLRGHTQDVTSARFSDDGKHALTSSRDGTAVLWLTQDGEKTIETKRAETP